MFNLRDYVYKNVIVVDTSGKEYKGYVGMYCSACDNDDTEESIGITPSNSNIGTELFKSEIKSIKII